GCNHVSVRLQQRIRHRGARGRAAGAGELAAAGEAWVVRGAVFGLAVYRAAAHAEALVAVSDSSECAARAVRGARSALAARLIRRSPDAADPAALGSAAD